MGWTLFGRDYGPVLGDPWRVLDRFIREAVVHPRRYQEEYINEKPIGEYLREAVRHLEFTTIEDIENAQIECYGDVPEQR